MSAELFRTMRLPLTAEEFRRLPRHPAFSYEWIEGQAWVAPNPRYHHALLDLHSFALSPDAEVPEGVRLRRLREEHWERLPALFASSFHGVQPYAGLDEKERLSAARKSIEQTRTGGDGPLLETACFAAVRQEDAELCGAVLVTLIPLADLSDAQASARWEGRPPEDCVERRLGRPHLTWVFVRPGATGHGIGTALLACAVRELLAMGFHDLATTFLSGNEQSMLWHWRNGFRLLAHPGSWREMRKRWN
jgi:GNAT superfamily N-acetyltransferase